MSTLQLVKAPLIVMGTISTWTTLTPPIPPPSFEERSTDINAGEKVFGRIVRYFVTALKVCVVPRYQTAKERNVEPYTSWLLAQEA